jgi:adenylate cyclase class 2
MGTETGSDGLPRETEVKFRVSNRRALEEALLRLGAAPGASALERDLLLDDHSGSLRLRGVAVRIRETAGSALLTFKGPKEIRAGVRSRVELETEVGDARTIAAVLLEIGLEPVFRYEKVRTPWRFVAPARPLVVVDETPIGLFAEIEGNEEAIRELAAELGVGKAEFLEDSYAALYLAARGRDPSLPRDMVFR